MAIGDPSVTDRLLYAFATGMEDAIIDSANYEPFNEEGLNQAYYAGVDAIKNCKIHKDNVFDP